MISRVTVTVEDGLLKTSSTHVVDIGNPMVLLPDPEHEVAKIAENAAISALRSMEARNAT